MQKLIRRATSLVALLVTCHAGAATPTMDVASSLEWRLVGPFRAGWVTAAAGAGNGSDTFYLGAAGGGVWKSDDAGISWRAAFDGVGSASVGALTVAPSDPNVIYAGMGQVTSRYDIAVGDGVYRSDDAGSTWRHLGLGTSRHIGAIRVHPANPDVAWVAALGSTFGPNDERGVYRTTDGGRSWQRTLFVSEEAGAVDLAVDPANPDVVFASTWQVRYRPWLAYFSPDVGPGSRLYKSTDGGVTWTRIEGSGWPTGALGRIGLATSPLAKGTRVWALIDAVSGGGLYRSDDSGSTWQHLSSNPEYVNGYFGHLTSVPGDPDTVYVMGRGMHRCAAAGTQCDIVKGAPGGDDYHFLWVDPARPERMITGADQGAAITLNGGRTWTDWYNQPTGQFYKIHTDDVFPYRIYGGQQDNGTVRIASRSDYGSITFRDWEPVGADERDYQIPDPRDPDIVYGSGLGGRLSRWNARNGEVQNVTPWPISSYGERPTDFQQRYSWITPIAMSKIAPFPLYFGSQYLWRSTDQGATWERLSPDLSAAKAGARDCGGDLDAVARARLRLRRDLEHRALAARQLRDLGGHGRRRGAPDARRRKVLGRRDAEGRAGLGQDCDGRGLAHDARHRVHRGGQSPAGRLPAIRLPHARPRRDVDARDGGPAAGPVRRRGARRHRPRGPPLRRHRHRRVRVLRRWRPLAVAAAQPPGRVGARHRRARQRPHRRDAGPRHLGAGRHLSRCASTVPRARRRTSTRRRRRFGCARTRTATRRCRRRRPPGATRRRAPSSTTGCPRTRAASTSRSAMPRARSCAATRATTRRRRPRRSATSAPTGSCRSNCPPRPPACTASCGTCATRAHVRPSTSTRSRLPTAWACRSFPRAPWSRRANIASSCAWTAASSLPRSWSPWIRACRWTRLR